MTELEKRPVENLQYSMDFSNLLDSGETISTITSITATLQNCDDTVVGTLVIATTAIASGSLSVTFWASVGVDNDTYLIKAIVVTNLAQTRQGEGLLSIREK